MFEDNRSHRLRRLVAELAECHRDDIDTILKSLNPAARQRVENLLGEYHSAAGEPVLHLDAMAADFGYLRLSPWLIERLSARDISQQPKMTSHAREALRSCAHALFSQTGLPERKASPVRPTLLTRVRMALHSLLRAER